MSERAYESRRDEIDRYVDGLLSPEDAASFESRLAQDASLREDVESLRAINASLRRSLGDWRHESPQISIPGAAGRKRSPFRAAAWLLAAASIVMLVVAGGVWWTGSQPTRAESLYTAQIDSGFQPGWVCDTDFEFARWTNNRLRQPLVPADPMPEGVTTLGWSFVQGSSPLSDRAAIMLASSHSAKVLVLADRLESDRRVRVSRDSGLHVHRRELGPLVLYEISPLESPTALNAIELAPPDIFDRAPNSEG